MEEAFGPHLLSLQYKRPVDSDQSAASREAKTAKGADGKGSGLGEGEGSRPRPRQSQSQQEQVRGIRLGIRKWLLEPAADTVATAGSGLHSGCSDVPSDGQSDRRPGRHNCGPAPVDCVGDVDADDTAFVSPHTVRDGGALEGEGERRHVRAVRARSPGSSNLVVASDSPGHLGIPSAELLSDARERKWIDQQGNWVYLRWNRSTRTLEPDEHRQPMNQTDLVSLLKTTGSLADGETVSRFAATCELTASMEGVVTFKVDIQFRSPRAHQLYTNLESLAGLSPLCLLGISLRKESYRRPNGIQKLAEWCG